MIAVGVAAAFVAAVAAAFAIVLQAAEARDSELTDTVRFTSLIGLTRRPRWLLGTCLLVLAWPLQILALSYAPITVVQPILATFQLVLLAIARTQLGERVGRRELLAALTVVAGLVLVVIAAPRHTVIDPRAGRLAVPLAVVGAAALLAYLAFRLHPRRDILVVLGAGLAYAWVDFADKLLSNDISTDRWGLAGTWLLAILAVGSLAFLEENTAIARRPVVTVGPVISAIQEPLPVVMALVGGVETWRSSGWTIAALAGGLILVAAGASVLGRSRPVARVAGAAGEPATHG